MTIDSNKTNIDSPEIEAVLGNTQLTETESLVIVPFERRLDSVSPEFGFHDIMKSERVALRQNDPSANIALESDPVVSSSPESERAKDLANNRVVIGFHAMMKIVRDSLKQGDPASSFPPESDRTKKLAQSLFDSHGIEIEHEEARKYVEHVDKFPEEPKQGFNTVEEYKNYNRDMNLFLQGERAKYNQNPEQYHPEDPEVPGKKMCKVTFTCADGRICPTNFLNKDQTIQRYATRWLPHAGLVIFPEVTAGQDSQQLDQSFQQDPKLKETVMSRLDSSLTAKVENYLKKITSKEHMDKFSRLHFEFQSHYDSNHPNHGCGAHKSNFDSAQAETIKDAMLVEMWLKERYPDQFAKGWFRIYRTVHDTKTGNQDKSATNAPDQGSAESNQDEKGNGHIYSASNLDKTKVSKAYYEEHKQMFLDAEARYSSPVIKGNPEGVFQEYKDNYVGIDEGSHSEQAIRIGDTHFAHTFLGQSVLEISWTNSPENLYKHIKILLGIIEANFRKNGENPKPAIVHFDLIQGRPDIAQVYEQTKQLILDTPEFKKQFDQGTLKIISSETNVHTYATKMN